jgi:hypothetical protein
VDAVRLLVSDGPVPPVVAAQAIREAVATERPFDLILGGADGADPQGRARVLLLAENWGIAAATAASHLGVCADAARNHITLTSARQGPCELPTPVAIALEPGRRLRAFTTSGYLRGLSKRIHISPLSALRLSEP